MEKFRDAIDFLIEDHRLLQNMFDAFEMLSDKSTFLQKRIGTSIIEALTLHTQLEEEIFYPKVRRTIKEDELMDDALVEHGEAEELMTQLKFMNPAKSQYKSTLKMLIAKAREHMAEEEQEMFPRVRKTQLDLISLGIELLERKRELEEEFAQDTSHLVAMGRGQSGASQSGQHF